jgi:hypothetical protein
MRYESFERGEEIEFAVKYGDNKGLQKEEVGARDGDRIGDDDLQAEAGAEDGGGQRSSAPKPKGSTREHPYLKPPSNDTQPER